MAACINCGILIRHAINTPQYLALDLGPELVAITEEWCGQEITDADYLCHQCVNLVITEAANRNEFPNGSGQRLGHECTCICCGLSLSRRTGRRNHRLQAGSAERNYIENLIFPRQVPEQAWTCQACWMRARRNMPLPNVDEVQLEPPIPELIQEIPSSSAATTTLPSSEADSWNEPLPVIQQPGVTLQNYSRTPDTPNHCFVPDCNNIERLRVPLYLKRSILAVYKIFITPSARVCRHHSTLYNWDILNEYQFTYTFNETQIEAMLDLLASTRTTITSCVLNFETIENANDTLCQYWTGLTVVNFLSLFNSVPQLQNVCKKAKTALGMYLVKLRTGEPVVRLATLFFQSKSTVCIWLKKTRNCLTEFYVPRHLGIDHMTRIGHSARNLLIPQGLFGTDNNNPIVICDGTYIYMQKSSNYLFQKKSYSLHKYRNLIKPFLMVTCDGYIIDALGPYAATQSDAEIMRNLFQRAETPQRSYFMRDDVFILDRGFRDSIPLLTSLGYSVHKPESLTAGETQLTTINANKSRCVTLCRWVVEVVNGRFKRDFKIFRGEYFNVASRNVMKDIRIAAALINNFHPVITDHPQAQSILDRALARIDTPNELADFVIRSRINRQQADFQRIDAQLPQLNVFPVMSMEDLILFGLGIYQIKQARSYYGEHIRQNGTFTIEVDTNLQRRAANVLLLRGRINSRHVRSRTYYTYILLDINAVDWCQKISQYYCSCIIGKRTVGSCAHVMTIVWYLGWARHQDNPILPPASFLDGILVRDDIENEE